MQLLRKKLEPEIETLVEAARDEALAAGIDPNTSFISQERIRAEKEREKQARKEARFGFTMMGDDDEDDDDEDDDDDGDGEDDEEGEEAVHEPLGIGDVWFDALRACNERLRRFADDFDQDLYTAEERALGIENVRTGLKRALEEDDDESEEDDEESEDDAEGDTAMRDMQPIAPSSGQPAGQSGIGAGGQTGGEAPGSLPGEDGEWMVSFGLRGNDELPRNLLEAQRRQAQRMR